MGQYYLRSATQEESYEHCSVNVTTKLRGDVNGITEHLYWGDL